MKEILLPHEMTSSMRTREKERERGTMQWREASPPHMQERKNSNKIREWGRSFKRVR